MKLAWILASLPLALALVPSALSSVDTHVATLQKAASMSVKFKVVQAGSPGQDQSLSISRDMNLRYETPVLLVISDGKTLTTYDKAKKTYTQGEVSKAGLVKLLQVDALWAWSAFFDGDFAKQVTSAKDGEEMNQKGLVLKQVKIGKANGAVTELFDAKLGAFRGAIYKKDSTDVYVQVTEMTVSDKPLSPTLFAWTAPEGATLATVGAADTPLVYADVKPIFDMRCTGCHGNQRASHGLNLASYESIMSSNTVRPGDSARSILVNAMRTGAMPRQGSMPKSEIDKIAKWVDDGAKQ